MKFSAGFKAPASVHAGDGRLQESACDAHVNTQGIAWPGHPHATAFVYSVHAIVVGYLAYKCELFVWSNRRKQRKAQAKSSLGHKLPLGMLIVIFVLRTKD